MTQQPDPDRDRATGIGGDSGAGGGIGRGPVAGAGTGAERYVRFLEPHQRGGSPNTVEGYLGGISSFATGAVHARGWRRSTAKLLVILLLFPIALTVLHWLWTLLSLLISF
jgi:hypothetical protein